MSQSRKESNKGSDKNITSPLKETLNGLQTQMIEDRYLDLTKLKAHLEEKYPGKWKVQVRSLLISANCFCANKISLSS